MAARPITLGNAVVAYPFACLDWETRIRAGKSLIPDGARGINPGLSRRAINGYNFLRLPDVTGTPTLAEASGEWFRDIVGTFLGAVDATTGKRIIRELFALAPKKSSKTSYGAGMMMTALIMNRRPRAEYLLVGPTKLIADLAFSQASGMVSTDDKGYLQKRFKIIEHAKTIFDRETKSKLLIKTFDTNVLTGVKPVGVLLDELHEISRNAKASKIIGQIRGGLLAFDEAFLAMITTQSDSEPAGAFKAELKTARAIRDGKATGSMLPVLYEFPKDIVRDKSIPPAWKNPANWAMVSPNIGRPFTIERLLEDFQTAETKGEEEIRRWASQHLNMEIGVALGSDAWPGAEFWESCGDSGLTLDVIMKRSDVCVAGVDGGGLDDLLGLAILGREKTTRNWLHWGHAWAHKSVFLRRPDIAARLRDFEAAKELTVVERVGDDVQDVADIIERLNDAGLLPEKVAVGVDPIGIDEIVDELLQRGLLIEQIAGIPQGFRLNGAVGNVERRVAGGTFTHGNQALMAWCVGNAKIEQRGNAVMITKQTSGKAKIDPLMALFDAARAMGKNPEAGPSVYEKRGLRIA